MKRLVDKNILIRKKDGKCYEYQPKVDKQEFINNLVRKTIKTFVDRFGDSAITAFVREADQLSNQERKSLFKKLTH
jgi:predicted transcriptional regulator